MDGCHLILVFQPEGNEAVGALDTVYKVAAALYHTLIDEFAERFFFAAPTIVMQELVPET